MALEEYKRKRDFSQTPEPGPDVPEGATKQPVANPRFRFVVQKHRASHMHFDFRLEMAGVLVSWAVPKGPSLDPADKRLAMHVEDHPISYFHFEGIIPEGNYGAGTVQVWDTGTWEPILDWDAKLKREVPSGEKVSRREAERRAIAMYENGDLKFRLHGEKLKGAFAIVKMGGRGRYGKGNEWLLIKKHDEAEKSPYNALDAEHDWSVLSKNSLAQIAGDQTAAEWESDRPAAKAKDQWLRDALEKAGASLKRSAAEKPTKVVTESVANSASKKTKASAAANKKTKASAAVKKSPVKSSAATKSVSKEPAAKSTEGDKRHRLLANIQALNGARKESMPHHLTPMMATLVDAPFDDAKSEWLFEVKWDGYRALCFLENRRVRLVSRNGNDLTGEFPELSAIAKRVSLNKAILDGEICALDEHGRSSFSLMQQRTGFKDVADHSRRGARDRAVPIVYYLFDILYADGYSLMRVDLEERKHVLAEVLAPDARFRYSDSFVDGRKLFAAAKQNRLEGIIAKRRNACYVQKRSRDWLKVKVTQTQECVIGGYTDPKGRREHFGSIVLGLYDRSGRLIHVGQAGSGFSDKSHAALWAKLEKLESGRSPFANKVEANRNVHYVRPELVAQIKFVEWTHESEVAGTSGFKMRAPVFLGLRTDKSPRECVFDFAQHTEKVVA